MARRRKTSAELAPLHPTRKRLLDLIRRKPGRRLFEIHDELRLKRASVKYNLDILERVGALRVVHDHGATRVFPADFSADDVHHFALLMRGVVLDIVREIVEQPGIGQDHILEAVQLSRRAFRVYADALKREGLLEEFRDGKAKRYLATPELARLYGRLSRSDKGEAPVGENDKP